MQLINRQQHALKVDAIARSLASRPRDAKLSLQKKEVSHQVPKGRDLRRFDHKVDVRGLDRIIAIDVEERTCEAESGVSFQEIVRHTLPLGLVPLVVPELKAITIGGAVSGCSLESMSFRCGGFHDTCLAYEVITAEGQVIDCSPEKDPLVFQMMQGSFGTLGVLASLRFKLTPAKRFVHVVYEHHGSIAAYVAAIERRAAANDTDFMDGMIHSVDDLVLCLGRFTDDAPYTNRYDWMKVYYQSTRTRKEDYLTTEHYFFRYDRGVTNVHPKSLLGRFCFGKLLDSTLLLRLADALHWLITQEKPDMTLDVFLPISKTPEFLTWFNETFAHFPLWCVPYRRVRDYEWLDDAFYRGMTDHMFVDIAIYGMKQKGAENHHRMMEEKLKELGGIKTLISHNYYSRDEFWTIWNRENYEAVKARVDPHNVFRDLYEKTCRTAMGQE
jgi:FAD/FMN-containing dehydrogenase